MPSPDTHHLLQRALRHHQLNQLVEAQSFYKQVLAQNPNHADALHYLGLIEFQSGRPEAAVDLMRQAIAEKNDYAQALANLGAALQSLARYDEAFVALQKSIALNPKIAECHATLGAVYVARNQPNEAIASYQTAVSLRPNFAQAHTNLGNIFQNIGEFDQAMAAHEKAIAAKPNLPGPYTNLGNALRSKGQLDRAVAAHQRALALDPNLAEAHLNLGTTLRDKGQIPEALASLRKSIALNPNNPKPWHELAHLYESQGQIPEAIEALQTASCLDPKSYIAYELAALGVGEAPAASPPQYITKFFDEYSVRFDKHLVEQLDYKGPQLLFDAVTAARSAIAQSQPLDILDLGCGTGLCGVLFRPLARRLVGVDLAPRMLDKSRQRNVYDELLHKDITAALNEHPGQFDLILSADVFIYVGRLDEIFHSAARALRPAGLFAFTIEHLEENTDYVLRRSRRYAQSLPYIQRLASENNFTLISANPAPLRKAGQAPEQGQVIVLQSK